MSLKEPVNNNILTSCCFCKSATATSHRVFQWSRSSEKRFNCCWQNSNSKSDDEWSFTQLQTISNIQPYREIHSSSCIDRKRKLMTVSRYLATITNSVNCPHIKKTTLEIQVIAWGKWDKSVRNESYRCKCCFYHLQSDIAIVQLSLMLYPWMYEYYQSEWLSFKF